MISKAEGQTIENITDVMKELLIAVEDAIFKEEWVVTEDVPQDRGRNFSKEIKTTAGNGAVDIVVSHALKGGEYLVVFMIH